MPFPSLFDPDTAAASQAFLAAADPVMADLIARVGPVRIDPEPDLFALLVRVVISQQISMAAAKTVAGRLRESLPRKRFTADAIDGRTVEQIRACGLSGVKARYIKAVAAAVKAKSLRPEELPTLDDAGVVAQVTAVRGLGPWSADMVLMFGLGRPDVLPLGDLGVRNAARGLYGFDTPAALAGHAAEHWAGHRSAASWYLWRHVDEADVTDGLNCYPV